MPSNHLILCHPLLLPPSVFLSIRVFSNESVLPIRWPKYCSFSFSISLSNEYSGLISFRMDSWISLQSKGLSRVFPNTRVQKHQFFSAQLFSRQIRLSHIHGTYCCLTPVRLGPSSKALGPCPPTRASPSHPTPPPSLSGFPEHPDPGPASTSH